MIYMSQELDPPLEYDGFISISADLEVATGSFTEAYTAYPSVPDCFYGPEEQEWKKECLSKDQKLALAYMMIARWNQYIAKVMS